MTQYLIYLFIATLVLFGGFVLGKEHSYREAVARGHGTWETRFGVKTFRWND